MATIAEAVPRPQPKQKRAAGADPRLPPGTRYCRCAKCGEYFLSARAFDRHRIGGSHRVTGDRRCAQTPRMRDVGLERDPRGYWRLPKREFRSTHLRHGNIRLVS